MPRLLSRMKCRQHFRLLGAWSEHLLRCFVLASLLLLISLFMEISRILCCCVESYALELPRFNILKLALANNMFAKIEFFSLQSSFFAGARERDTTDAFSCSLACFINGNWLMFIASLKHNFHNIMHMMLSKHAFCLYMKNAFYAPPKKNTKRKFIRNGFWSDSEGAIFCLVCLWTTLS